MGNLFRSRSSFEEWLDEQPTQIVLDEYIEYENGLISISYKRAKVVKYFEHVNDEVLTSYKIEYLDS